MSSEKIILGIDPGTTIMGFGLIKVLNKKIGNKIEKIEEIEQFLSKLGL